MLSSDKVKKQEIIDQLTWNDSVNADNIQVKVSGNTALLEGIVPNYASKISAAINANMIRGINYVENNLKVELPVKS
ncbi:MAG TPA: BON domain-containing protein, partial [Bacteroidales bacterium]|nr:BON domain-containing protein [Bacteroidales bacterium]